MNDLTVRGALDDRAYPAYTMSAAADLAGVTPAFLRGLGNHGLISPGRSSGGQRHYSRAELDLARRVHEVTATGVSLAAACRIVELEGHLAAARAEIHALREQLPTQHTRQAV
ncbi:MerR family transcriptional regulator [Longispora sp. NPDC051575]|uniref:MerR family transcriptional regulator n=1 Tax=Longispora sp. NPDC051575 TaxID=3154943 RepID=UPI00341A2AB3